MSDELAVDFTTGRLAWPWRTVSGAEAAMVRAWTRLRTQVGTYPEDPTLGLDHLGWTQHPRPTAAEVSAAVRTQCELVAGITVTEIATSVTTSIACSVTMVYDPGDGGDTATFAIELYPPEGTPPGYAAPAACRS